MIKMSTKIKNEPSSISYECDNEVIFGNDLIKVESRDEDEISNMNIEVKRETENALTGKMKAVYVVEIKKEIFNCDDYSQLDYNTSDIMGIKQENTTTDDESINNDDDNQYYIPTSKALLLEHNYSLVTRSKSGVNLLNDLSKNFIVYSEEDSSEVFKTKAPKHPLLVPARLELCDNNKVTDITQTERETCEAPHTRGPLSKLKNRKCYTCSVCFRGYTRLYDLSRHSITHTLEKAIACDICGNTFSERLISHNGTGNVCDVCKGSIWFSHTRQHEDLEKSYPCGYCNKVFTQKHNLKRHEYVHKKIKPFACNVCGKRFTDPSAVGRHENIHNDSKPYECPTCNRSFKNSCDLVRHKLIHTGERPYPCNICGKRFRFKSNLRYHINIHTGNRPFKCNYCDKRFISVSCLSQHERKNHNW